MTTYKRNGDAVASPMWIVLDGHQLSACTPADAWQVKRIQHDSRVTLAACSRTGKVRADRPVFDGTAEVISDPEEVVRIESFVKQKYGFEFRIVTRSSKPLRLAAASPDLCCASLRRIPTDQTLGELDDRVSSR